MPEESYAFRLRYTRSPRDTVNCFESKLPLPTSEPTYEVILKARDRDKNIESSSTLVLHGAGWSTPEEADRFGHLYSNILARACVRLRLGADFGDRAAKGWFTKEGLDAVSQQTGKPVLNDVHGLMIYEQTSRPSVIFASTSGSAVRGINLEQFLSVYTSALSRPREISEEERAALLLFNASFFPESPDGRFMLLMMGVEALIERQPQPDNIKAIVQQFLAETEAAAGLSIEEKSSLMSGLGQLRNESIRQAGRRLVREKLNGRKYKEMLAEEFFDYCYSLRGKLVHCDLPLPTRNEVGGAAATLEVMLSDLLSTDLLDVGPQP